MTNIFDVLSIHMLSKGNPGALRCVCELNEREDRDITLTMLALARIRGVVLYVLWCEIFQRDTEALADALMGLSYHALSSIAARIEFKPDDLDGIKLELGRFQKAPSVRTCRECGCTDENCSQCVEKTGGPCQWVEADLCSACVPVEAR